ncbi:hypothetical protein K490DRAFT_31769 [Saccharata proteae CBS 121410]|uniref:Transcription factor BYE1 n=1 Tax=Saccharata proteae CBS 121410 TaxID=1314787 RepID=A0A9P4M1W8_9PEZI|nr:hypothetical protein K490DRAFT_31769 [Saccharata proteae CBS 121410]
MPSQHITVRDAANTIATDSVRKSSRATKGQHTKDRDLPDTPVPKRAKGQTKKAKEPEPAPEPEDGGEDAIIRCICGSVDDEGGRMMVCCEQCDAWQHNDCMGIAEDEASLAELQYYCEQCRPEDHVDTVQALQDGVTIWETRLQEKQDRKNKSKKGKKASRKSRVSEVRTTMAEAGGSSPTPVSQKGPTKQESEENGANGIAEVKSPSEPAAPVAPVTPAAPAAGEKRRNETTHDPTPKRRKSSQPKKAAEPAEPAEPTKPTNIEDLPKDRGVVATKLRDEMAKLIRENSKKDYRIPDGETPDSLGTRYGIAVEDALNAQNPGGPKAYALKFRTIFANLSRNFSLVANMVDGSLAAEKLVSMTEAEMQTDEQKKRNEEIMKQNDRANTLVQEEGPRYRKTHKGEEIIEENNAPVDTAYAPAVVPRRESQAEKATGPDSPMDEDGPGSPMAVELPEDVGATTQPLRVDTSQPSAPDRRASSNFNMDNVWSSVKSPDENQRLQQQHQRKSSAPQNQNGPVEDPDIDRLLNNDENDMGSFSPVVDSEESIKWRGEITMQNIGGFNATARFAGGADIGALIPYKDLIPQPPIIDGRIDMVRTEDYIRGMRNSQAHDVVILSLTPEGAEGKTGFDAVFQYFYPRQRWGVISHGARHNLVRDVYIIPIPAGMGPLPECITLLENLQIEPPVADNMLLLMLVVKTGDLTAPTPGMGPFSHPGAYQSPITATHGSPMNHAGFPLPPPQHAQPPTAAPQMPMWPQHPQPPQQPQQNPQQQPPPPQPSPEVYQKAYQILGPLTMSPSVLTMLSKVPEIKNESLQGLKTLLEDVPATRDNFETLIAHLERDMSRGMARN